MDLAEPPTGTDAASPESATAAAGWSDACGCRGACRSVPNRCRRHTSRSPAAFGLGSASPEVAVSAGRCGAPEPVGGQRRICQVTVDFATRCLLIYVVTCCSPIINPTGDLGPILGIALSLVSMVAIFTGPALLCG